MLSYSLVMSNAITMFSISCFIFRSILGLYCLCAVIFFMRVVYLSSVS